MDTNLRERIVRVFGEVFTVQTKVEVVPDLDDETVLLETGLDSLGFAILVIRLEEELGYDPFVLSAKAYYPRTYGDLVRFYEANAPR